MHAKRHSRTTRRTPRVQTNCNKKGIFFAASVLFNCWHRYFYRYEFSKITVIFKNMGILNITINKHVFLWFEPTHTALKLEVEFGFVLKWIIQKMSNAILASKFSTDELSDLPMGQLALKYVLITFAFVVSLT